MELDIVTQEHVDVATLEVSQDSFLLFGDEVWARLNQIYMDIPQVVCELAQSLQEYFAKVLTLSMSDIMMPEPGPISTRFTVLRVPRGLGFSSSPG